MACEAIGENGVEIWPGEREMVGAKRYVRMKFRRQTTMRVEKTKSSSSRPKLGGERPYPQPHKRLGPPIPPLPP